MMNSGLTFGMEGPMMEGTWYNTNTGDSFTVRNSFFEDNQFIIQTTDGRVLGYDQIQDYIKSDKPINVSKPSQQATTLPQEVTDLLENESEFSNYGILEDDMAMISGSSAPTSLGNLSSNNSNNLIQNPETQATHNSNYNIINKALTKRSFPDFQVGIVWDDCPIKEINMLMELMDVEESEIVDWYLSQCDVEHTTNMIKQIIEDHIYKQLHPEVIIKMDESKVEESEQKPKKLKSKKK